MSITIGRVGYFGLGLETTPATSVAATVFLPYTDFSLRGHHEPFEEIASKTSRHMDRDSVNGKKWGEGDVQMNLDMVNSGYLFKMALGNEVLTTGTPNTHNFYTTVSGNTPKTASIYLGRDTDQELYIQSALDELSIEVADKIATMKCSLMSSFPTNVAAQTATTTSGTVVAFDNYNLRFGTDLTGAAGASATPANDFSMTIANNVEVIHRSGSSDVSTIRNKGLRVKGKYTLYFDSITERDAYYSLSKRAMEVKFTGNANEDLKFRIPRFRLSEGEITTGLDDFFVINCQYVAEDVVDATTATRLLDITLRNSKATTY